MKIKIGLGCSKLGSLFNYKINSKKYFKILEHSYKRGIRFYDTSNIYRNGNSEIFLSKYFLNKKVIISTKFGYQKKKNSFILKMLNLNKNDVLDDYEEMKKSVFQSLKRMKFNYIDILFWHSPHSLNKLQLLNAFKTMNFFKMNKTIKYSGISISNQKNIEQVINFDNFDFLQLSLKNYLSLNYNLKKKIFMKKNKIIINQFFYNLNKENIKRDKYISKYYNLLKKEKNIRYILVGTTNTNHLDYFLNYAK